MMQFYQPSNRVSGGGVLLFLLGGVAAAAVLALAYVYAVWYIPLIYVNFFATVGFGLGLGWVLSRMVRAGKLRSPKTAGALALVVALVAEYLQWAVYLTLIIGTTDVNEFGSGARKMSIASTSFDPGVFLTLLLKPGAMFGVIRDLASTGSWSLFGVTVSGIFLVLVWLIEAGMIVLMPFLSARAAAAEPFSETAGEWAVEETLVRRAPHHTEAAEAAAALTNGSLQPLHDNGEPLFCRLKLYAAPNDLNCRYVSLDQVRIEVDNKGKESEKTNTLLEYLALSPGAYEQLRASFSRPFTEDPEAAVEPVAEAETAETLRPDAPAVATT